MKDPEYESRRMTNISVLEVPPRLAAYLVQFGQIHSVTSNDMNEVWNFKIMLGHKTFISISNCLDVESQKRLL